MVRVIENISYGEDAEQSGDLVLPENAAGAKVILMIHGGAWISMSRKRNHGVALFLAENGYAVYNIDYRLHPGSPYPACEEDCINAAEFLLSSDHPDFAGLSRCKIYINGYSAGAHLALMAGLKLPRDKVAGIIEVSGPTELCAPEVHNLVRENARLYSEFEGKEQERLLDLASPTKIISGEKLPPLLIVHNNVDTVVDHKQAVRLADSWLENGGQLQMFSYDGDSEKFHDIWREEAKTPRLYEIIEKQMLTFLEIF